MSDNRMTELLKDYVFALRRLEYAADKPGSEMTLGEYEAEEKKVTDEYSQAIAATFGNGKLTVEQVEEAVYRNCKFYEGGEVDVESITDELNSRVKPPCGGGYCPLCGAAERTCEIVEWYEARDRHEIGNNRVRFSCGHFGTCHFKFCAECGAKVVNK